MRKRSGQLIFSPSDLITHLESPFASWMDRFHLEHPGALTPDPSKAEDALVAAQGDAHEQREHARLRDAGRDVWTPPADGDRFQATVDSMRAGREVLYQAELRQGAFEGKADFLRRIDEPSALGAWSYEIVNTKLARTPKPYFLVQLCAYTKMLEVTLGGRSKHVYIVGGDGVERTFRTDDYHFFFLALEEAFLAAQRAFDPEKRPIPEPRAEHRRWTSHAEKILEELDHPSRVAGIASTQVTRLAEAGITTMCGLADSALPRVPRMDAAVFARLRQQARLQRASVALERPLYELVPTTGEARRGLELLPPPSPADVFFDMEGYPFAEGGLEYLFGASHVERGERRFVDFWGHDAAGERRAFEDFIDWVWARFRDDPSMHIYHYASYEVSAVRRLMGKYGTREDIVDALLRAEVFVNLYTIVRQSVRIGEPRYSLKNVEHLYRPKRAGDVATAGESLVQYARWLAEPDGADWHSSKTLCAIRDYNREDCESTLELRDWLFARQAEAKIAYTPPPGHSERDPVKVSEPPKSPAEMLAYRMLGEIPEDRTGDSERWRIHELLANLLLFHKREGKPVWWAMFDRQQRTQEELVEDPDCLGFLTRTNRPPAPDKRSRLFEYSFNPDQDTKLLPGKCYIAEDLTPTELASLDLDKGIAVIRVGPSRPEPPRVMSLIPDEFVSPAKITEAIQRVAELWDESGALPGAVDAIFRRLPPRLRGRARGLPLTAGGVDVVADTVAIVSALDESAVAIQGPPGAGKTFTAAAVIVDLLAHGKRIGIASNGHKAIEKLMAEVLAAATKKKVQVRATKIKSTPDDEIVVDGRAAHAAAMKNVVHDGPNAPNLVGGTAWAFADPAAIEKFDYLFVDEAGQVSLANLVGMSTSARNVVLLGDQMQLSQPVQGAHPGEAGLSVLDYLLGEHRTIPSDLGIFLSTTWRMHPAVCRFISGAIYEDRLTSDPDCERRCIEVPASAERIRTRAGLVFVPVAHEGNVQASDEEVGAVRAIIDELRGRTLTEKNGKTRSLTDDDVLVVAPYNMQVRRLRAALPRVQVGSVDKFQGQEAPVVIFSMCASTAEGSARGLNFIFNSNRLNVAISRAQCLAIVVGSPQLAHARVASVEQMRLANLFCRIVADGGGS